MASVKTYRVLHDGLRVGDSVRYFGDPIPEAAEFPNLRSYLRAEYIEEVFMDEEDLKKQMKEIEERSKVEAEEEEEGNQEPESVNDPDPDPEPKEKTKKAPAKKVAAKSKTKKRTVKKKKDEGNERRLTEQSV